MVHKAERFIGFYVKTASLSVVLVACVRCLSVQVTTAQHTT